MICGEGWATYLRWRPEFAKAIDEWLYPLAWLDERIMNQTVRLVATDDAAIVYEFKQYPSGAYQVEGLVAAGNASTIVNELIPVAEHDGRQVGAVAAQIESRAGWAKLLRGPGYSAYQTTIRKRLA